MSDFEEKLGALLGNSDAMGKIMSMASSLGGSEDVPPATDAQVPSSSQDDCQPPSSADVPLGGDLFSALGSLDPRILQTAMRLFSEYNATDDRKAALLTALRPFVREKRYAKVDRAIQVAKLSRVIRIGLELFKKEE
ncbi:MAG: hypothetical protein RSC08_02285 [Oscillospiraceae bacterium]